MKAPNLGETTRDLASKCGSIDQLIDQQSELKEIARIKSHEGSLEQLPLCKLHRAWKALADTPCGGLNAWFGVMVSIVRSRDTKTNKSGT